jgi:hypothetical protein
MLHSTHLKAALLVAVVAVSAGCSKGGASSIVDPMSLGGAGVAAPAEQPGEAGAAPVQAAAGSPSAAAPNQPTMPERPAMPPAAGSGNGTGSPRAGAGPQAEAGRSAEIDSGEARTTVIAMTQLNRPTDLEFNPYVSDELWVMNHGDGAATIISRASTEARSVQRRLDPEGARHFMPQPAGFAFGARETTIVDAQGKMVEGTFATCPESEQAYMGPTLWTSDLRIFAITKREREPPFNGPNTGGEGPGSHIDMLHRTPTCAGIAWEGAGNVYWTYSGGGSMLVKYDFGVDHGIGNTDHSDGSVWRYQLQGVRYLPGVPSHLEFERGSRKLFLADTGNGRVVTFDPSNATDMRPMSTADNVDRLREALDVVGGQLTELVAPSHGLVKPSGLAIHDGTLYVGDNETGIIHKFSLAGMPLGKIAIPGLQRGALAGLAFGPDGKLYFTDMFERRVLRLDNEF